MRFTAILALTASLAAAADITVLVGENAGLTFNPTSVTAAVGDVINFEFVAKNHTLTQSTFAAPCDYPSAGIDSGYVPVAANATEHPVWSLTVNNATAPLWFYCAQTGHCAKGMVFAINPSAAKTFAAFQAAAMGGSTTGTTGSTSGAGASATGSTTAGAASPTSGAASLSARSVLMLAAIGVVGLLL
ncbi:hypothetical protein BDZ89DRAFT_1103869 [Hymenopellis radicata]|nr:hypothetical protein BDZ89DRAFT_1103869 [Hymenopellis radicata]